jgi:hypothetical protein
MFCSECGQQSADDAKFCMKCGKKLIAVETVLPSSLETEKPSDQAIRDSVQTSSSSSGDSAKYVSTELKESGAVTAMSVIGFVFGMIGMGGSFIPCIGSLAFYIGIPAAIISAIALGIAYSQNAKRTFAIVAVTISLIGVVISGWQYFSIISAGKNAERETKKMLNQGKSNIESHTGFAASAPVPIENNGDFDKFRLSLKSKLKPYNPEAITKMMAKEFEWMNDIEKVSPEEAIGRLSQEGLWKDFERALASGQGFKFEDSSCEGDCYKIFNPKTRHVVSYSFKRIDNKWIWIGVFSD